MSANPLPARRLAFPLLVGFAILGTAVITLLSPFFLASLATAYEVEWEELSWIGQTYGAASALLSAFALLGVGISILLQDRESRRARHDSARSQHFQLMQMLIDNPDMLEITNPSAKKNKHSRQHIFLNLQISSWETLYSVGQLSLENIREYARSDLFITDIAIQFWGRTRDHRRKIALGMPRSQQKTFLQFFAAIDDTWLELRKQPPPAPPSKLKTSDIYPLLLGGATLCCTTGWLLRSLAMNRKKAHHGTPCGPLASR